MQVQLLQGARCRSQQAQEDTDLVRNLGGDLNETSCQGYQWADVSNISKAAACRRAARSCQLCHPFRGQGFGLLITFHLQLSGNNFTMLLLYGCRLRALEDCTE